MKALIKLSLAGAAGALLLVGTAVKAQVNDAPITEKWFPTEYGADDKAGAINRISPDVIMKAVKLVKKGKSATLGKYYHSSIPGFGPRVWNMQIPGTPTGGPFGRNALIYHDEFVQTEIGQISTQFDGPGHIGVRTSQGDMMYNGRLREKVYTRGAGGRVLGMGDAGVENVAEKAYVCRGVLLDAASYKGWTRLPIPKDKDSPGIVTAADLKGMIAKQGIAEIGEGDCVFLHTGHGDLWANSIWKTLSPAEQAARRDEFKSGEPGYGISACRYMAERKIAFMGGDTSANDAQPFGEEGDQDAVPCHTDMQTRRGIWNIENLDLNPLVKEKVYEFLFVWSPLKIIGGTGSPGNPVAVW
jgi:kynurenine formamidase